MSTINCNMVHGTRPCIVMRNIRVERTNEELKSMFDELTGGTHHDGEFARFCTNNRHYHTKEEAKAYWHMFAQETMEDNNGNIQYVVAVVEFDDGTIKTVDAESVRFINENKENKDE